MLHALFARCPKWLRSVALILITGSVMCAIWIDIPCMLAGALEYEKDADGTTVIRYSGAGAPRAPVGR